jgi:hypothetical protein
MLFWLVYDIGRYNERQRIRRELEAWLREHPAAQPRGYFNSISRARTPRSHQSREEQLVSAWWRKLHRP